MISKDVISKSLDNAISKCGQRFFLNSNVKKTFNTFHDRYCNTDTMIEHAIMTDEDGNIVWENEGDESSVALPQGKELAELHKEHGTLYFTHNHPREFGGEVYAPVIECLSKEDIRNTFCDTDNYVWEGGKGKNFIPSMKSVSCESYNGSRMTLTMGDNYTFDLTVTSKIYDLSVRLENYYNNYYHNYYKTFEDVQTDYLNTLDEGTRPTDNFKSEKDYLNFLDKETVKKVGVFEKNKEFKEIQEIFRKYDFKLTYTFPRHYHRGT